MTFLGPPCDPTLLMGTGEAAHGPAGRFAKSDEQGVRIRPMVLVQHCIIYCIMYSCTIQAKDSGRETSMPMPACY